MCGIAGIFFKTSGSNQVLGKALVDMLDGCQHRGPDSTGFALYEDDVDGLRLRFIVEGDDAETSIARIRAALAEQTVFYQRSSDRHPSVFELRHGVKPRFGAAAE